MKNAGFLATTAIALGMAFSSAAQAEGTTPEDYYKMSWLDKGVVVIDGVDLARQKAKRDGDQLRQACISYTYPLDNKEKNYKAVDDIASSVQAFIEVALKKGMSFASLEKYDAEYIAQKKIERNCTQPVLAKN